MKRSFFILLLIAFLGMGGFLVYTTFIHQAPKAECVSVAVLYAKRIKKEAKIYQDFETYFEKERAKIHEEVLEKEKVLRLEFEGIKKGKKNKKDVEEKKAILQEKLNDLSNNLQIQKENFLETIHKLEEKLQKELQLAIDKIIKKNGFNLVLNAELDEKTMVFYSDSKFDITDEIISELNKKEFNV
ncbi:MAG: OmpH family outer membrane protein [Proteobacteria bacterium]|nr:OmpH family outer membrane protein [Pseudomonadota bacterium]